MKRKSDKNGNSVGHNKLSNLREIRRQKLRNGILLLRDDDQRWMRDLRKAILSENMLDRPTLVGMVKGWLRVSRFDNDEFRIRLARLLSSLLPRSIPIVETIFDGSRPNGTKAELQFSLLI